MTQESNGEKKTVLVIGGGISGLTAARDLCRRGIKAVVVEKGGFAGGHAAHFACKATESCVGCNGCLVEDTLRRVAEEGEVEIRLKTRVTDLKRVGPRFFVSLTSGPAWIDPEKCTDCGTCYSECPDAGNGAMERAPSPHHHPFYVIDPAHCGCSGRGTRPVCETVCPEGAVSFDREEESWSVEVDGIILATGYEPFDPRGTGRYGFSRFENMITGMDLERMLREKGRILRVSDGSPPRRIAFVQCVGSRDARRGREYCSRVCCGYALRMALKIVHDDPRSEVTVFYMDIQNFGKDFRRHYAEAREKLHLRRGLPGDFDLSEDESISVTSFDEESGSPITESFDMVVLSVGMTPPGGEGLLVENLELSRGPDGFLEAPLEEDGGAPVVIAGAAEGPMDISESISHAKRAVLEIMQSLDRTG